MNRALGILIFACGLLSAHQQPTTLMVLDIGSTRVATQLHIPLPELELAFGHRVTETPDPKDWEPAFRRYLIHHIHPSTDGAPWQVRILNVTVSRAEQKQSGPFQEALVSLELTPPPGARTADFTLAYDAILHQVVTHKVLVSTRNAEVGVIQVDTETGLIPPLRIQNPQQGFGTIVTLGMQHIREGTDHMLFLLTLLLPLSLRGGSIQHRLISVLKVVTAFTVGHSITLLAGALEWIRLPQQPVEILIAVSILVSAIHAIRPIFPAKEAYVAATFGLIHGLGFASGLTELRLDASAMAWSILGFNLGIEAMQLFVIALTMPWLLMLSLTSMRDWVRIGGSVLAAIAAIGWIANRISGDPNAIEQLMELAAKFSGYGIPALALIAIPAFLLAQKERTL